MIGREERERCNACGAPGMLGRVHMCAGIWRGTADPAGDLYAAEEYVRKLERERRDRGISETGALDFGPALDAVAEALRRVPTPCPRCHGRGYFTEDPAPDCPSVAYVGTEIECRACEGSGETTT